MNRPSKYIYLLVIALLSFHPLAAQYFVADGTPCPRGTDVKADTLTFASDTTMPFDRCFYLRLTLKGDPKISRFTISPIDKDGSLKVRRRDYRVSIKSSFKSRKERRQAREVLTYSNFRKNPFYYFFEGITPIKKGENTEIILNVPPLDPNREYQIRLIGEDQASLGELYLVGEMIFKSEADPTQAANATELRKGAQIKYELNAFKRGKQDTLFSIKKFKIFKNSFAAFEFEFNSDTTAKALPAGSRNKVRAEEHRIFLSPSEDDTPLTEKEILDLDHVKYWKSFKSSNLNTNYVAQLRKELINEKKRNGFDKLIKYKLKSEAGKEKELNDYIYKIYKPHHVPNYISLKSSASLITNSVLNPAIVNPEKINFTLPIKDTKGTIIEPYKDAKYKMELVSIYFKNPFDKTADQCKPKIIETIELGELEISNDGIQYQFTPKDTAPYKGSIKVSSGKLISYKTIKDNNNELNSMTHNHPECFSTSTLNFLMEKALVFPGVENGVKDLTLKDDLTRTLSILFEQRNEVLQNIKLGIISLKDPITQAKSEEYSKRKTNVETSVAQIVVLEEFIMEVMAANSTRNAGNIYELVNCFKEFRKELNEVITKLDIIIDEENKIKSSLINNFNLLEVVPATSLNSTSLLEFVNEAKFRIVPDFGLIATFKGDKVHRFNNLTPYLGFHINFRPIDKNIPLRLVRYKSWRHRLSFISGITLSPLKIENRREDVFEKSTLITGLGFRITNYFKFTGGAAWFKAIDTNPLSNDKPLRFSPFVGVSFDLDIQELLGGINRLIK